MRPRRLRAAQGAFGLIGRHSASFRGNQFGTTALSDGNLTITNSSSNPGTAYSCGTSHADGKYYFELQHRSGAFPNDQLWLGGIVSSTRVPIPSGVTYVGADSLGVGVGLVRQWGVFSDTPLSGTPSPTISSFNFVDWIGFAVDITGRSLSVTNATSSGGIISSFPIPATVIDGTHPILIAWSSAANAFNPNMLTTLNVGVTPFVGSIPAGFSPWDPNP
jgi:hypothetical protein